MAELPEDVRLAVYGYNPKTGKAFTEAESRALNGGFMPSNYVDIVDYSFDKLRGELTIKNKAGMSSTLGASFKQSSAGAIVPDIERMNQAGAGYGEDVAYDEFGVPLQYSKSKVAASQGGDGTKKVVSGATVTPTGVSTTSQNLGSFVSDARPGAMTTGQQDVYSAIVDRLNKYNLGSLAPLIRKLAIEGATESTIMLRLQDEPVYQERFKANQERIKKGISVLTPSQYLNLEDSYRQILRAYGLNQFDNDAYVGQFISNDVSPAELSNRVVTAVQRVRNADPAVSNMLRNYYGIGQNDLVAYVLDPNQQFQKIERQVAASEIGVAAGRQGLNIGSPVAEQLAAQGITQAEAQRGYATIADILPTAEKLSDIYGTTLDRYGLAEGEQEVFNQLASAQRKRQRLVGREIAEFSGQSGVGRGSLGTATGGQY
jgi:hypothetical protein